MADVPENELLAQLAAYQVGRVPAWTSQTSIDDGEEPGPPDSVGLGIDVDEEVVALVRVELRRDPSARYAEVWLTTVDNSAGAHYRVTVDGTDYDYICLGGETETFILQGLIVQLTGCPDAAPSFISPGPGRWSPGLGIGLTGRNPTGFDTLAVSVPVGTGVMASKIEAENVEFKIWDLPRNLTVPAWGLVYGAEALVAESGETWDERLVVSGHERLYVEVVDTDGVATPMIAPCVLETAPD